METKHGRKLAKLRYTGSKQRFVNLLGAFLAVIITALFLLPRVQEERIVIAQAPSCPLNWWGTDWKHRRKFTFTAPSLSQNVTDVPVLVTLTPSRIDYSKVKPNGDDLRFTDASASPGVAPLPYEIESWNPGGTSSIWVKVPQIDKNSTTDSITLYYGNPAAADGQNPASVWDSSFTLVQHLEETTGLCDVADRIVFGVRLKRCTLFTISALRSLATR